MKIDCGPTKAERQSKARSNYVALRRKWRNWHRVFAFLPVRVGPRDCRWLEYIERRDRSYWDERRGALRQSTWDYARNEPLNIDSTFPEYNYYGKHMGQPYRAPTWEYRACE